MFDENYQRDPDICGFDFSRRWSQRTHTASLKGTFLKQFLLLSPTVNKSPVLFFGLFVSLHKQKGKGQKRTKQEVESISDPGGKAGKEKSCAKNSKSEAVTRRNQENNSE